MDYKTLNSALKNLSDLKVAETISDGDYSYHICPIPNTDVFVKIQKYEDSYGEERIIGLEFVKPREQRVTNYEPIND